MENCVSNNKSEQSVSGASDNRNFFDKTHSMSNVNVCSGNTLLNDSSNILTAHQKLSTEAPPKSKPKTKTNCILKKKRLITFNCLPPKYTRSDRESNGVVKPIIPNFPSYTVEPRFIVFQGVGENKR